MLAVGAPLKSRGATADSTTMADERVRVDERVRQRLVRQRVENNLAWARDEVVVLVGTIALPSDDRLERLIEHLGRLTEGTEDPARRLALLLQFGAAMSGVFESVDRLAGLDRLDLADDLFTLLHDDLEDRDELLEWSGEPFDAAG